MDKLIPVLIGVLAGAVLGGVVAYITLPSEEHTPRAQIDGAGDTSPDASATTDRDSEVDRLNGRIFELQAELRKGQKRDTGPGADGDHEEVQRLNDVIDEKNAEIERLEKLLAARESGREPEVEVSEEPEESTENPTPDELDRMMAEWMPLLRAGDRTATKDLMKTTQEATRETRDELIRRIRDWATEEPQNKRARLILASLLTTRFQDLDNPIKQGALAGEIKEEIEKATEIDPDYYDAWHFMAVLKVNYPPFTLEFKSADKALDKALELQKDMAWEDRFAEIYAAYSMWHRKLGQLDDAAEWARKGLDKAPRDEGLLAEQKAVEEAREAEEE